MPASALFLLAVLAMEACPEGNQIRVVGRTHGGGNRCLLLCAA